MFSVDGVWVSNIASLLSKTGVNALDQPIFVIDVALHLLSSFVISQTLVMPVMPIRLQPTPQFLKLQIRGRFWLCKQACS